MSTPGAATTGPGEAGAHDARFLFWLSLGQLVSWGSTFYLFGLLLQPAEAALGLSRAQSSLGFSLMLLAEGIAAPWVGRWIDRGHARAVMTAGSAAAGLCLVLMSQVDGWRARSGPGWPGRCAGACSGWHWRPSSTRRLLQW